MADRNAKGWKLRATWIGAFARSYNHPLFCADEWEARRRAAEMFDTMWQASAWGEGSVNG